MAKNVYRNALIVQRLRNLLKEKKRILYFGTTSNQTLLMYAIIRKLGYNAGYVDANTNKEFRAQFVEDFRNGEIDIIFNHSVFTTGFDAPETNVVFIARPICSPILISQMIGRGLRGSTMWVVNVVGLADQSCRNYYDQAISSFKPRPII